MSRLQIDMDKNILKHFKDTAKNADLTQRELLEFLVHDFRHNGSIQEQAGRLRKYKSREGRVL